MTTAMTRYHTGSLASLESPASKPESRRCCNIQTASGEKTKTKKPANASPHTRDCQRRGCKPIVERGCSSQTSSVTSTAAQIATKPHWLSNSAVGIPPELTDLSLTLAMRGGDRKSTRLNSSHLGISYAVF